MHFVYKMGNLFRSIRFQTKTHPLQSDLIFLILFELHSFLGKRDIVGVEGKTDMSEDYEKFHKIPPFKVKADPSILINDEDYPWLRRNKQMTPCQLCPTTIMMIPCQLCNRWVWYHCPFCTRSASSFCRNPLNFLAHAMWMKWWYHANFQPFQSSFEMLYNFRVL